MMAADPLMRLAAAFLLPVFPILDAADYRPPADLRPAARRVGAASILPGGRVIRPFGRQAITGPGAFGIAVAGGEGRYIVTANAGPGRYSISVVEQNRAQWRIDHHVAGQPEKEDGWRGVFLGLAFESGRDVFVSEGASGRVRLIDVRNGRTRRVFELDEAGGPGSHSGDLAFDAERNLLFVLDWAASRVVIFDTDRRRIVSSVGVGPLPFALALAACGTRLWVAHASAPGTEDLRPGSVAVLDVENPAEARVIRFLPTRKPASGITVASGRAYVSHPHSDSITVIDAANLEIEKEILLRIPGLEPYRGILPIGSLLNEATGWLLVAEAGINAIGVIDTRRMELIGHIPTAWYPTRLAQHEDVIYVACAKGYGTGPNADRRGYEAGSFYGERRRGAMLAFAVPDSSELPALTRAVLVNNGFVQREEPEAVLPAVEHVVLIVKGNRAYDEIMGDIQSAGNGPVNGIPVLARFGRYGVVNRRRGTLQTRLGLRNVNVTPNHHALARQFSFSENFYSDAEESGGGLRWLAGVYPAPWTEALLMTGATPDFPVSGPAAENRPEAGSLWDHLERHNISYRIFQDDLGTNLPDQERATRLIEELDSLHAASGQELPRFLQIHLPNDRTGPPRPGDGYPFDASFVADNDYALGRIIEYLSGTRWWAAMAVFVTESSAQGLDHIDSHRTVLLAAGPYARPDYVSRVNSSYPGLLKTVFRLLRLPPLHLYDAAAADLGDCFHTEPDFSPYEVSAPTRELFDPEAARGAQQPR